MLCLWESIVYEERNSQGLAALAPSGYILPIVK